MNAAPPAPEEPHRYVPVRLSIAIDDKQLLDYFLWDMDRLQHQQQQQKQQERKQRMQATAPHSFLLVPCFCVCCVRCVCCVWCARTDEDMTPEHFARQTCLDCDVPVAFEAQVSSTLRWHLARARAIARCPEAHNKLVTVHVCPSLPQSAPSAQATAAETAHTSLGCV